MSLTTDLANCGKTRLAEREAELAGAGSQQRSELRGAVSCAVSWEQGARPDTQSRAEEDRCSVEWSGHRDHNTDTKDDSTGPAPFTAGSSSSHSHWSARTIPGLPLVHPPPAPARVAGLSWLAVASSDSSLRSSYPRCTKPRPWLLAHWPRHIPGHPHPMSVCSGD